MPGFPGPYVLTKDYGSWLGTSLGAFSITDLEQGVTLDTRAAKARAWSEPGRLRQRLEFPDLVLESTLVFADGRSALLAITLEQRGANPGHYLLELADSPQHENVRMSVIPGEAAVTLSFPCAAAVVETRWSDDAATVRLNEKSNGFSLRQAVRVPGGGSETGRCGPAGGPGVRGPPEESGQPPEWEVQKGG